MEDFCTLAQFHVDDLSTHAISLAVLARALNDAHESGNRLDRAAFHRAADLALTLFGQEKLRSESMDSHAPLLDAVYLKAFVPGDDPEEEIHAVPEAIAHRFHAELVRLVYLRPSGTEDAAVGCGDAAPAL